MSQIARTARPDRSKARCTRLISRMCGRSERHYTARARGLITILAGYRSRMRTPHHFAPVRVLVGDTAVGLPVVDLGHRAGTRGGEPGLHLLPGGRIRQVEHELVQPAARVRRLPGTDDLQVNLAAGQREDGPVQAIAVVEGLQDRQPDGVPVEGDRLLVTRAPPHHSQRAYGEVRWPVRRPGLGAHGGSLSPPSWLLQSSGCSRCLSRPSPSRTKLIMLDRRPDQRAALWSCLFRAGRPFA